MLARSHLINKIYYQFRPFIPGWLQIFLRRKVVAKKRLSCKDIWPINKKAGRRPDGWLGWPGKKQFALVLTHDVDTAIGQAKCLKLTKLEEEFGFRSSFNFVPERYNVSPDLRHYLTDNGFEVGVHGLKHDGKLYRSRKIFQSRSIRINHYLKAWESVGFRSPAMHCNLDWIHDLNIEYDASTFDTDPFEPQPDGVGTIFPFCVRADTNARGYVELPYTLPQDFTLFVLMKETSIDIWKQKLDWIVSNGGMALLNTHPDYMNFDGTELSPTTYPAAYYVEFLKHLKSKFEGQYWHVLPRQVARFCSSCHQKL